MRHDADIIPFFGQRVQQLVCENAAVAGRNVERAAGHALDAAARQLAAHGVKAHVALEKAPLRIVVVDESGAPDVHVRVRPAVDALLQLHERIAVQLILRQTAADGAQVAGEKRAALDPVAEAALDDERIE